MMVLISYDIEIIDNSGKRRLRRVAKECQNFGQRVQYSIFECEVDPAQWVLLKYRLLKTIDEKFDSLRFYFLGSNWKRKVEHHGVKKPLDFDEPMVL